MVELQKENIEVLIGFIFSRRIHYQRINVILQTITAITINLNCSNVTCTSV